MSKLAPYRKVAVAVVATVAQAVSLGLIPDPYNKYAFAVLAVAEAVGVYHAPNDTAPAAEPHA